MGQGGRRRKEDKSFTFNSVPVVLLCKFLALFLVNVNWPALWMVGIHRRVFSGQSVIQEILPQEGLRATQPPDAEVCSFSRQPSCMERGKRAQTWLLPLSSLGAWKHAPGLCLLSSLHLDFSFCSNRYGVGVGGLARPPPITDVKSRHEMAAFPCSRHSSLVLRMVLLAAATLVQWREV